MRSIFLLILLHQATYAGNEHILLPTVEDIFVIDAVILGQRCQTGAFAGASIP